MDEEGEQTGRREPVIRAVVMGKRTQIKAASRRRSGRTWLGPDILNEKEKLSKTGKFLQEGAVRMGKWI